LSEVLLRRTSSPNKIAAGRWSAEALRGEFDRRKDGLRAGVAQRLPKRRRRNIQFVVEQRGSI
jgi:hypothetical protein